jgi:hypothetical protein
VTDCPYFALFDKIFGELISYLVILVLIRKKHLDFFHILFFKDFQKILSVPKTNRLRYGTVQKSNKIIKSPVPNFLNKFCGSMTFWCGSRSGSADPCL